MARLHQRNPALLFYADLHVHSRFSRATSRDADLPHLALWAAKKGLAVVGTGDFTHPAWRAELKEQLVPAEPGLFRLRPEALASVPGMLPGAAAVRFLLEVEISTIYKKGERTRKVHHLIYVPDFEAAERLVARLSRIGNLNSDGRPILGLDSRDLLEITLESGPDSYLVPAHIWTPWFAAMGSKSGFDSIEECYGDLAGEIFAVETGLSSDPPMNWRLSQLDRFRLVSNSDAHSPPKLGREATAFDTDVDYFSLRRALETGEGFAGTVEFFPEEGKYHADGHRKCGVRLTPEESRALGGRCPGCGGLLTLGVAHRVAELADREEGPAPPATAGPVRSLIPLGEILAELSGVGVGSRAVEEGYERLVRRVAPELEVLERVPPEEIEKEGSPLLAEAIGRLRRGEVHREAGYDGEYGVIRLFTEDELASRSRSLFLFDPPARPMKASAPHQALPGSGEPSLERAPGDEGPIAPAVRILQEAAEPPAHGLDPAQEEAASVARGPLLILAGPGAGKTRTLTHRIARLVQEHAVPPERCLAITFTRRAAGELSERLAQLLPAGSGTVAVHTFHSFALAELRRDPAAAGLPEGFTIIEEGAQRRLVEEVLSLTPDAARRLLPRLSAARRRRVEPEDEELARAVWAYRAALTARGGVDFDELLVRLVDLLETDPGRARALRERYPHLSIDEYQDVDALQVELVRRLANPAGSVCAIGDPDQSIYGFRGADPRFFDRFQEDFPGTRVVRLAVNYRSTRTIVEAAGWVIGGGLPLLPWFPRSAWERQSGRSAPSGAGGDREAAERPDAGSHAERGNQGRKGAPASPSPGGLEWEGRERGTEGVRIPVFLHQAPTERAEAEWVVHSIEELLGGHTFFSLDSGRVDAAMPGSAPADLGFADFAVLVRTEAQSWPLVEALARSGIPFQKRAHTALAGHPELAPLLERFWRRPARGTVAERLAAAAAEAIAERGEDTLRSELEALLAQLQPLARRCGEDAGWFAQEVALAVEVDTWDPRADRVSLLTLHAAKGLEFRVVFVAGCEDGLLPFRFPGEDDPAALAEERRLFYVGLTRAKERLLLSWAKRRTLRGEAEERRPSPFLATIAEPLLLRSAPPAREPEPEKARQLSLF
ncbi:MAG TPA: UvrD-helicase domain-containing protein [Thermoanaerobaculia bacterium]|nr:UvrD-helicase domain-containing protein [Thermoanaerobaculia bacterium]